MTEDELKEDMKWLLANPGKSLLGDYHDAASCWQLIEAIADELRRLRVLLSDIAVNSYCETSASAAAEAIGGEPSDFKGPSIFDVHSRKP